MTQSLRVVSYNVFGFRMLKRYSIDDFAAALASLNPDIIFLQEVDEGRLHSHNELSVEILSELLGMNHIYHPVYKSRVSDEKPYGNAVISSYPLQRIREDHLPAARWTSFTEPRGVLLTELDVNGFKIRLFNTHLSFWMHEQGLQMRALASEWTNFSGTGNQPAILAGDFNMGPNVKNFQYLDNILTSASRDAVLPTWPSQRAWRQLDYIFVNSQFQVLKCFTPTEKIFKRISDHLPVVADLNFSGLKGVSSDAT